MSLTTSYGKQVVYGIGLESAYGTAMVSASGLCVFQGLDKVDIDAGIKQFEYRDGRSAEPTMQETITTVSGSRHTISIAGKLSKHMLPHLLHGHMQNQSAGVYTYWSTHPSTPRSYTFVVKDPITGRDRVYSGCVMQGVKVSGQKGEPVMFEATLVTKGPVLNAQTLPAATSWKTSGSKSSNFGTMMFSDMQYQMNVGSGYSSIPAKSFALTLSYSEITQENPQGDGTYADAGFGTREGNQLELTLLAGPTTESIRTRIKTGDSIGFKTANGGLGVTATGIVTADPDNLDVHTGMDVTAALKATDHTTNQIQFSL